MAKTKTVEPRQRVIDMMNGIHPDHQTYHRLTFYSDGTIRISRPWCSLLLRREMEDLDEKATSHKWLIWKIQEGNGDRSFWKPNTTPETEQEGENTEAEVEPLFAGIR